MALFLTCSCGSRFEVEDTFAGQAVTCPECQAAVKVPMPERVPLRTSGYALASVVLALVGAFTLVGSAVAVLFGVCGLISISRNRGRLTGSAYAVFGIVAGVAFTSLTLFAYTAAEVFGVSDQVRERMVGHEVDRSGPREVVRADDGFAITRPSPKWGVARSLENEDAVVQELERDCLLTLVSIARPAYVDVTVETAGALRVEQYQEKALGRLGGNKRTGRVAREEGMLRFVQHQVRKTQHLPALGEAEVLELLVEVTAMGQGYTFLIRLIKANDGSLYIVRGWTQRRRFHQMEPELRRALDSFRLVARN
jgi:hypothetical protein